MTCIRRRKLFFFPFLFRVWLSYCSWNTKPTMSPKAPSALTVPHQPPGLPDLPRPRHSLPALVPPAPAPAAWPGSSSPQPGPVWPWPLPRWAHSQTQPQPVPVPREVPEACSEGSWAPMGSPEVPWQNLKDIWKMEICLSKAAITLSSKIPLAFKESLYRVMSKDIFRLFLCHTGISKKGCWEASSQKACSTSAGISTSFIEVEKEFKCFSVFYWIALCL